MRTLLLVDDEDLMRSSFCSLFQAPGLRIVTACTACEGWRRLTEDDPDVVVLDLHLPDRSGLELFADLKTFGRPRPVIFVTGRSNPEATIQAMRQGAFDYLLKPIDPEQLRPLIGRALAASRIGVAPAAAGEADGGALVGHSPAFLEMCKTVGRLAPQDVTVLILGETGSGKELVARALHRHSPRTDRPFLAINCAAIPENLLESELFGHEKGAFTGADRRRIGKFEQCDGGTLFLDEIGDMAAGLQAKMLRVLQEQRFERLGGNEPVQTRVRLLAATNQDLPRLVSEGRFRADLYYRLNVTSVRVPALRERPEDIEELARHFLARFSRVLGREVCAISPEALQHLQRYSWPGNVRELEGVIQQALLRASGPTLLPEFLPDDLGGAPTAAAAVAAIPLPAVDALVRSLLEQGDQGLYQRVLREVDRCVLGRVLAHTHGCQTQASELLGLSRGTVRKKLRTLGLGVNKVVKAPREGKGPF